MKTTKLIFCKQKSTFAKRTKVLEVISLSKCGMMRSLENPARVKSRKKAYKIIVFCLIYFIFSKDVHILPVTVPQKMFESQLAFYLHFRLSYLLLGKWSSYFWLKPLACFPVRKKWRSSVRWEYMELLIMATSSKVTKKFGMKQQEKVNCESHSQRNGNELFNQS